MWPSDLLFCQDCIINSSNLEWLWYCRSGHEWLLLNWNEWNLQKLPVGYALGNCTSVDSSWASLHNRIPLRSVMMIIVGQDDLAISWSGRLRSFLTFLVRATRGRRPHNFSQPFGQDDLWDAMEEYKEAKEMMLDIGRQILLKVSVL